MRKPLLLLFMTICLLVQLSTVRTASAPVLIANNVIVEIAEGDTLGFGGYPSDYLLITAESGDLNTTHNNIQLFTTKGHFNFYAIETCTLSLTSENGNPFILTAQGVTKFTNSRSDYTIGLLTTGAKNLRWSWVPDSPFNYTSHAMGLFGLGMMIGAPIYTVKRFREQRMDEWLVGTLIWTISAFIVGWGLFYMWVLL